MSRIKKRSLRRMSWFEACAFPVVLRDTFLTRARLERAMRRRFPKFPWRRWHFVTGASFATFALRLGALPRCRSAWLKRNESIEPSIVALARKTAASEIRPIDDIRSTARYRVAVVSNLLAEFLEKLGA